MPQFLVRGSVSRKLISLCWAGLAIIVFALAAVANSGPPPDRYWFNFSGAPQGSSLQGVQIVHCDSAQCHEPVLLLQHGTCSQAGCLAGRPTLSNRGGHAAGFLCETDTCFWAIGITEPIRLPKSHQDSNLLKMIGQYTDRVRSSPAFQLERPELGKPLSLSVQAINERLEIKRQSQEQSFLKPLSLFHLVQEKLTLLVLGISIGSELVVTYFYLRWIKVDRTQMQRILLTVLAVHGFSLPLVWMAFPALATFNTPGSRASGIAWILFAVIYGLLLTVDRHKSQQDIKIKKFIISTVAFWSLTGIVAFFCGILDYGFALPLATGLPQSWMLPASEIFVWLYEAWIIYVVNRQVLNYRSSNRLSLGMNAVSFMLGMALIHFSLQR